MTHKWKHGDKFKLDPEAIIDTHIPYDSVDTIYTVAESWHAGVITTGMEYFLFTWMVVPKYLDTPLWKKLEGLE